MDQVLEALVNTGRGDLVSKILERTKDPENAEVYRSAADEKFARDGEIEFDDDAVVSLGDDPGAYVQGWIWVDNETAGIQTEEDEG